VTCYTHPCKPCKLTYILHYLPQGGESSPRGRWGICAPALPEVLTIGVGADGSNTMVAYIVSQRQCGEISGSKWKTQIESHKKSEKVKPTENRSPTKKPDIFNV
jgi:hypothetical protein